MGVLAGVIAFSLSMFGESTYGLVEDSSALAAMTTGVLTWGAAEYLFHLELGFLLALATSTGVYVATAALRLDERDTRMGEPV